MNLNKYITVLGICMAHATVPVQHINDLGVNPKLIGTALNGERVAIDEDGTCLVELNKGTCYELSVSEEPKIWVTATSADQMMGGGVLIEDDEDDDVLDMLHARLNDLQWS